MTILRQIANCAEQFLKSLELRGIIKKKEKILSTEEQAKFELLQVHKLRHSHMIISMIYVYVRVLNICVYVYIHYSVVVIYSYS